MEDEFEQITMHVVTKGGETYARYLGTHNKFSDTLYLTNALENGGMVKVDNDTWLSLENILRITFRRDEVH